jgi:hypothetical protein
MSEKTDSVDFHGILGRAALKESNAELRFYPLAYSTTLDAKCVFVARFEGARFQEAEIGGLLNEEVEVTLFADRAEVVFPEVWETILRANTVAAEWCAYDTEDFVLRIGKLDAAFERLNAEWTKATQKNRRGHELTREFLRRAEVKASASEELKVRQAEAIAVLRRLLRHFESREECSKGFLSGFLTDFSHGLVMVEIVSSPRPQTFRARVKRVYAARQGIDPGSRGAEIEFVGAGVGWGLEALSVGDTALVFLTAISGRLYEPMSFVGHMVVEEIDGETYAIYQERELWLSAGIPATIRDCARQDPKRSYATAVRLDAMEAYLLTLIEQTDRALS